MYPHRIGLRADSRGLGGQGDATGTTSVQHLQSRLRRRPEREAMRDVVPVEPTDEVSVHALGQQQSVMSGSDTVFWRIPGRIILGYGPTLGYVRTFIHEAGTESKD